MARTPVPFSLRKIQRYSDQVVSGLLAWFLHGSGAVFVGDKSSGVTVLKQCLHTWPLGHPIAMFFCFVLFFDAIL